MNDAPITQQDLAAAVQSATLSAQLTGLVKDVSDLRRDFSDHEKAHEDERKTREQRHSANLRWAIGLAVTLLASNGGVIAIVITHLH